jgi:hypothetical protein
VLIVYKSLSITVGIGFLLIWIYFSSPPPQEISRYKRAEETQTHYCSENNQQTWGERFRCDPVADFTALLALFTAILGGVAIIQIDFIRRADQITRDALRLSRDEFNATHRPKLILRQAFSFLSDWREQNIVVTYVIANIGETRCWISSGGVGIDMSADFKYPSFMKTPDMFLPRNAPFIGAIEPGESKWLTHRDPSHKWDHEHRQIFPKEGGIHFVGYCIYIDAPGSNIKRQLTFRRRYNLDTQRFERIWDSDNEHDYAD